MADAAIETARRLAISSGLVMALVRATETAILAEAHLRAASVVTELLTQLRDQAGQRWVADALEVAAVVLDGYAQYDAATELLLAADAMRRAAGETIGGIRSIGLTVRRVWDRLVIGGRASPTAKPLDRDAAIARALEALVTVGRGGFEPP